MTARRQFVAPLAMPPALWALRHLCGLTFAEVGALTGIARHQFSKKPLSAPAEAACVKLLREQAAILRVPRAELDPMLRTFNEARARLFDVITGDHGRKLRR